MTHILLYRCIYKKFKFLSQKFSIKDQLLFLYGKVNFHFWWVISFHVDLKGIKLLNNSTRWTRKDFVRIQNHTNTDRIENNFAKHNFLRSHIRITLDANNPSGQSIQSFKWGIFYLNIPFFQINIQNNPLFHLFLKLTHFQMKKILKTKGTSIQLAPMYNI